ncbi:MAG: hypothetical protein D6781_13965 [Verrucomicrobia bacterium]|nr:MAG: hypothetical protein D6781_13965 [Verrucomicrobiota bacterium]
MPLVLATSLAGSANAQPARPEDAFLWPEAGAVFTENIRLMTGDDWRVTDPGAARFYPEAVRNFLPNPRLDLPTDFAGGRPTAAALIIDYWSGHPGTVDKRVRLNDGPWLPLEDGLAGIAAEESHKAVAQHNPVLPWPIDRLNDGTNTIEGSCGPNGFNWGQWGWNAVLLRVFLDPETTPPHPARLNVPDSDGQLPEQPVLAIDAPETAPAITEVRFYARCAEAPDWDGDGRFGGWQGFFHAGAWEAHIGTITRPPWRQRWDTTWLPDQPPGGIALVAHVRDARGVWTVTPVVDGLSLLRDGRSVTMHRPHRVMPFFWVRDGRVKSAVIPVPLDTELRSVRAARLHIRGWNLRNNEQAFTPMRINTGPWLSCVTGRDHGFSQHLFAIDPALLQAGDNLVSFTSSTRHHGAEILWPGPTLLLEHDPTPPRPLPGGKSGHVP